jgi:hypothetical protein
MGTNFEFHSPNADELAKNLAGAKDFIKLSHDIGGTGVKVKPNAHPKDVPVEKTLAQIGAALAELGDHALGFGQEIRLEVHGKETSDLGHVQTIMAAAARECQALGADIIDINLGCPSKNVTSGCSGSALMREPELARRIFDAAITAGIEPELGFRLVRVESEFNPSAVSSAGALGLTQLMLGTARHFQSNVTRDQLLDPVSKTGHPRGIS